MAICFDMRMIASAEVVTRRLDDELVLLNLLTENYFGLDAVGTRMWEVLASAPSVQAAFDQLLSEYDVEAARLRRDLEKLLSRLVEHGLIELQAV
jgi:Coenzyme PQQ synthesis protein D (PqqD)